jgi:hypothetical protein
MKQPNMFMTLTLHLSLFDLPVHLALGLMVPIDHAVELPLPHPVELLHDDLVESSRPGSWDCRLPSSNLALPACCPWLNLMTPSRRHGSVPPELCSPISMDCHDSRGRISQPEGARVHTSGRQSLLPLFGRSPAPSPAPFLGLP